MPKVELDDNEWSLVMGIIATAPWRDANPLLMKIGNQLRIQQEVTPINKQTNSGETPIPSAQVDVKQSH